MQDNAVLRMLRIHFSKIHFRLANIQSPWLLLGIRCCCNYHVSIYSNKYREEKYSCKRDNSQFFDARNYHNQLERKCWISAVRRAAKNSQAPEQKIREVIIYENSHLKWTVDPTNIIGKNESQFDETFHRREHYQIGKNDVEMVLRILNSKKIRISKHPYKEPPSHCKNQYEQHIWEGDDYSEYALDTQ